jgi:hypothetical protein
MVASESHVKTWLDVASYSIIQAVSLVVALLIARALVLRRERPTAGARR